MRTYGALSRLVLGTKAHRSPDSGRLRLGRRPWVIAASGSWMWRPAHRSTGGAEPLLARTAIPTAKRFRSKRLAAESSATRTRCSRFSFSVRCRCDRLRRHECAACRPDNVRSLRWKRAREETDCFRNVPFCFPRLPLRHRRGPLDRWTVMMAREGTSGPPKDSNIRFHDA